jgi:hypothetical protein
MPFSILLGEAETNIPMTGEIARKAGVVPNRQMPQDPACPSDSSSLQYGLWLEIPNLFRLDHSTT